MIEIITSEVLPTKEHTYSIDLKNEALEDEIFGFLDKKASALFIFPRKIIKEFFIASLTIIKDREQFIQKIIDKDLVAIEELNYLVNDLQQKGVISKRIDSKKVSKLIFSSFFMDMIMYIFDGRIEKEDAFISTKENILYLIS